MGLDMIWDRVIDYCINQGPGFVFGGIMFFLYWKERAKNSDILKDFITLIVGTNKALDANTSTISINTKTLEGFKCKYSEKM